MAAAYDALAAELDGKGVTVGQVNCDVHKVVCLPSSLWLCLIISYRSSLVRGADLLSAVP